VKKLILTLLAVGAVASSYGQGQIAWADPAIVTADQILIKALNGTTSAMPTRTTGNTATYYCFAVFAAATQDGLLTASPLTYGTNSAGAAGGIQGANVNISGIPGGSYAYVQVRAWNYGTIGFDWNTIHARVLEGTDASIWYGESAIAYVQAQTVPPNSPHNIFTSVPVGPEVMIDGFTLQSVPEPSTIALVGLGLAGLVFIRRRK